MKTAYSTGPGFYAAATSKTDASIPQGVLRVHCVRLEGYDLPPGDSALDDVEFEIVFAKAENDPRLARALLSLGDAIRGNSEMLQEIARRDS